TGNAYQAQPAASNIVMLPAAPVAAKVATTQSTSISNVMLTSHENHTSVGSSLGYGLYPGYAFPVGSVTPVVQEPALESLPVETPVAANAEVQTPSPSDAFEPATP